MNIRFIEERFMDDIMERFLEISCILITKFFHCKNKYVNRHSAGSQKDVISKIINLKFVVQIKVAVVR
jgi:hypothetical protein